VKILVNLLFFRIFKTIQLLKLNMIQEEKTIRLWLKIDYPMDDIKESNKI